jgi:two-component system, cell cycle sensor histidine kinase and response regulator CckA
MRKQKNKKTSIKTRFIIYLIAITIPILLLSTGFELYLWHNARVLTKQLELDKDITQFAHIATSNIHDSFDYLVNYAIRPPSTHKQENEKNSDSLKKLRKSITAFKVFLNAFILGTDSQEFKLYNDGEEYQVWKNNGWDKQFQIYNVSPQIKRRCLITLLYLDGFVNHSNKVISYHLKAHELFSKGWVTSSNKAQQVAATEMKKTHRYQLLVINELDKIIELTDVSRARTQEHIVKTLRNFLILSVVIGFILFCLFVVFSWFFINLKIIKPLFKLTQKIRQLGKGYVGVDIVVDSDDEIGEVAEQFNQMRIDLQQTTVSKDYLDDVIRSLTNMLILTDADGMVEKINRAAREILGYTNEDLLGKSIDSLFVKDKSLIQLKDLFAKGFITNVEKTYLTKKGKEIPVLFSASTMLDEENNIYGIVTAAQDITKLKSVQKKEELTRRELQQAQKLESVGQLAGGIAHDFNNLLAGIAGYTETIKQKKIKDKQVNVWLDRVISLTGRAAELTQQLLRFARKGTYEKKHINLNDSILEARNILYRSLSKSTAIKTDMAKDLWSVEADPLGVLQALVNLGINAHEAMPEGGELIFETQNISADKNYVNFHKSLKPGNYARIGVTDTGTGVKKEILDHIFDPFFTTKPVGKGTGLGLAMVYGILQELKGFVFVYSEEGRGTTFHLYFPADKEVKAEPVKQEKQAQPIAHFDFSGKTILVADDEEYIRDLIIEVLEGTGAKILAATNGDEALELYKNNQDSVDLVLLDVIMPKMDGVKLFKFIYKINPKIKGIFLSGYSPGKDIVELRKTIQVDFIQKPFKIELLLKKISQNFHSSKSSYSPV